MQPFGQVPAFEDGDLKLFGKIYMYRSTDTSY
jgi:glutathione S-transferase